MEYMDNCRKVIYQYPSGFHLPFGRRRSDRSFFFYRLDDIICYRSDVRGWISFANDKVVSGCIIKMSKIKNSYVLAFEILDTFNDVVIEFLIGDMLNAYSILICQWAVIE